MSPMALIDNPKKKNTKVQCCDFTRISANLANRSEHLDRGLKAAGGGGSGGS